MKKLLTSVFAFMLAILGSGLVASCGSDEPGGSSSNGGYGTLGGNLITIGSTRDVTYTSCVLLGTVDFPKITSDHTYGIVYMEALLDPDFDYDTKLLDGGKSDKTDKIQYVCTSAQITSSATDGKFEKQLVKLKPATTYYYRAYVKIGQNVNYSKVESVTTKDPMPEITMSTGDATDIFAVAGTMNGYCNVGNLQDVNEQQAYGFIFTTYEQLSDPSKLTYEYYEQWLLNHFETEDDLERPSSVTSTQNLNGRIACDVSHLVPGTTYYYRTFFCWNNKYFYSPEVKTLNTLGLDVITVGTNPATDLTDKTAVLNATFPYSQVGLTSVYSGFLISKVYSNASEFKMEDAVAWNERYYYPKKEVFFVSTSASEKDFSYEISGLDPETTYYVCAFISLGTYDGEPMYVYGPVTYFTTEVAGFGSSDDVDVWSEGQYAWSKGDNGYWYSGNSGIRNSHSDLYIEVEHKAGQRLEFSLKVSSEYGCDGVNISWGNNSSGLLSGDIDTTYSIPFTTTGKTSIVIDYYKDGSMDSGDDRAIVGNFVLL